MGLFDRLWRVIRANINSLVGAAEDPEKILEQAVMDMQEDLIQLRQAVAGAIAAQKRTERQCSQAESTAAEWYQRAQLALQKGEEHLAREALTRKKSYQETATAMKASLGQQNAVVAQLKENMRSLESKISEAKSKKDMYIARARSAKASERLQEMMGNLSTGSALSAFEKMEEKVMQLEARSEAIAELGTNDLEKKFLSLEAAGDVDAELAAMKTQMLPGKNTPKLPSGEPPTS
ncbi:MAG: PspA/IM30 family protein [Microcoleus sp. PH2017_10_PVI_O_A]|uniref:PspA/IM30 family protein n=1 Tax=unclassified Microcoleus TaxID=2642155 RepID=UPI001D7BFE93|nr:MULTISPECIES: PspA/IM30 family protein [unclassified Microcoleus]TAE78094.1 MAG: PspA/IM30 family protein [Oscillatoriales cyanobacterium]MCC3407582.1 PspA/IM30 family protein [Microcoleus sp. PH2017_10_PVI_O_A]MCC3461758.1 PspA/IM30 family protein [Microcoleus sp. PH2017_11_PCY_U_A]MCC3480173.1 PspA/IM30 family protein [Microcoleus sp. PH2017_12_PCY_D_A]MCC3531745.1 PspA/IM30 family protein [Microcoleus sp. PH2017_21_RUC_O_A]